MTDEGAPFQPGAEQVTVSFRDRSAYAGYKAFGGGDDAVLVEPDVARELRTAAEFATREGRVTGGLLFGRGWVDDLGAYLVVNGFLEAGPGENSGDRPAPDGTDDFTLSEADLRLLREDAARMYSARLELGWWRTLATLGEFGPQDFMTQAELVGPDGVGLLVYGSGIHWGTAYLGPDGRAPDSAGTLVSVPEPPPDPEPVPDVEVAFYPEPEPPEVVDLSAGESLLEEPLPLTDAPPAVIVAPVTPAAGRTRRRVPSRVRVPARVRVQTAQPAEAAGVESGMPADVQLVLGALSIAVIAVGIIVGVLVHSMTVAIIIAVVGPVAIYSSAWMSRR